MNKTAFKKSPQHHAATPNPMTEEVAGWTLSGFIEGGQSTKQAYTQSVANFDWEEGETAPSFAEIIQYFKDRSDELEQLEQSGDSFIVAEQDELQFIQLLLQQENN